MENYIRTKNKSDTKANKKSEKNAMRAREPNSWSIRCQRTWTRGLAVSCPSTIQLLIRWTSGTTEWTFMTNCPSSLNTFLLRLQVRRTLKWGFLCAYCWSQNRMTKSLQMRACLKLNKKILANTAGINAPQPLCELWNFNGNELYIS